jgi:hypothetical protein
LQFRRIFYTSKGTQLAKGYCRLIYIDSSVPYHPGEICNSCVYVEFTPTQIDLSLLKTRYHKDEELSGQVFLLKTILDRSRIDILACNKPYYKFLPGNFYVQLEELSFSNQNADKLKN